MEFLCALLVGILIIMLCHFLARDYAQKLVLNVLEDIKNDLEKEELKLLREVYKEKE